MASRFNHKRISDEENVGIRHRYPYVSKLFKQVHFNEDTWQKFFGEAYILPDGGMRHFSVLKLQFGLVVFLECVLR